MMSIFAMMLRILVLASCLILQPGRSQFLPEVGSRSILLPHEDVEPGLYLTPYIKKGELDKAKNLSEVTKTLAGLPTGDTQPKMYSGYLTVDEVNGNHLFFSFVPATKATPEKSPVVMWLQGGPGTSSFYGFFEQLGPYTSYINDDNEIKLKKNDFAWSNDYNLLIFDQPVGAGFSYTEKDFFPDTQIMIADQLYKAITQFFTVFHEFKDLPFFCAGESYAGKYVPAISKKIHDANNAGGNLKINLTGMAIGNGYTSPLHSNAYGNFLYQLGIIGDIEKDILKRLEKKNHKLIKAGKFYESFRAFNEIVQKMHSMTGCNNNHDFTTCHPREKLFQDYVDSKAFRDAFHVGNTKFGEQSRSLQRALLFTDIQASQLSTLAGLVDQYQTMVFSGNRNILVHTKANLDAMKAMTWSGQAEFLKKASEVFQVNNQTAGYIREVKTLMFVSLRNVGDFSIDEKPEVVLNILKAFINKALSI